MKIGRLTALVTQNLRRSARTLALGSFGISAAVASLTFFLGLGEGMRRLLLGEIFPVDQIEIVPRQSAAGSILGMLGGGSTAGVNEAGLAALREVRGVSSAYPRMRLRFPAQVSGGRHMFGRELTGGELPGEGVEAALLRADLRAGERFEDPIDSSPATPCTRDADCPRGEYCQEAAQSCQRPVPVVISRYAVELYNSTIAPVHGTPRLGEWLVDRARNVTFNIELGQSLLGVAPQGTPTRVRARLVGISRRAMDLGVTLPLPVVRRWNRTYGGEGMATEYSSVTLLVRHKGDLTRVAGAVRRLGYDVREGPAEQAGEIITLVTVLLSLLSFVIVGIAAVSVAHTFLMLVSERRTEIALFRALGASRGDIRTLILSEALLVGAAAALAGIGAGIGVAWICDIAAVRYLPDLTFRPESYFAFPPVIVAVSFIFGLVFSVLGAYVPAGRAARLDPAAALSGA